MAAVDDRARPDVTGPRVLERLPAHPGVLRDERGRPGAWLPYRPAGAGPDVRPGPGGDVPGAVRVDAAHVRVEQPLAQPARRLVEPFPVTVLAPGQDGTHTLCAAAHRHLVT